MVHIRLIYAFIRTYLYIIRRKEDRHEYIHTRVNTVNLTLTTYNMGPTQQINSRVISTEESRFKLALLPDGVLSVETVRPSRLELDESALINIWQAHKQRQ